MEQVIDPAVMQWFQTLPPYAQQQFMAETVANLNLGQSKPLPVVKYRNIQTSKNYKSHSEDEEHFITTDKRYALLKGGEGAGKSVAGIVRVLNKLQRGFSGIMVCVAADTLVDDIPIAERNKPAKVDTVFGPRFATPSYCEGQADLFRVVTQSGEKVTVTASHRFLTPTGWRQLHDLRVGDLIAADDSDHEWNDLEKLQGFQDYYFSGFHLYDELSNLLEQYGQDKLLLPVLLSLVAYQTYDCLNRVYIDHSFLPPYSDEAVKEYYSFCVNGENELKRFDVFLKFLLLAYHFDNLGEYFQYSNFLIEDNDGNVGSDHIALLHRLLNRENNQQYLEFPVNSYPHHIEQEFYYNHIERDGLFSYSNYNTKVRFTQIDNISFQKYGDFYGLTVPSVGHYSANGLFHHNSPDLPHFKKSLWPEFRLWCPRSWVIPRHQYRLNIEWAPSETFELVFKNDTSLLCGGIEKPGSWEGPNRNFAHLDEGRHADAEALKVLDGRCRIGKNPQVWITTTPKKNWLWEYFGPPQDKDKYLNFKQNSLVITLPLELNRENLAEGYIENRRNSLTESEARVRVDAEWEDESDTEKFVNVFWWDACKEELPPLTRGEPAILALDAATGSEVPSSLCDCFTATIITRHPHRPKDLAIRYCGIWQADLGHYLDFEPIENELERLTKEYSILEMAYDPTQLHDMAMRFRKRGVNAKAFSQGEPRQIADKDLQQHIMSRRIVHDGNPLLRQHIDNADIKKDTKDRIRIIKRTSSLKVDAAVSVSMGAARALYYNLG